MVLRFFLFIWGSILLTIIFVVLIITLGGVQPPDSERIAELLPFFSGIAHDAYAQGGEAAVVELFTKHPSISNEFGLSHLPAENGGCVGERSIGLDRNGDCLTLSTPAIHWVEYVYPPLLPLLSGLAISIVAGMILARHLSAPIRKIEAALVDLAHGNLGRRVNDELKSFGPEMIRLGKAFDQAATQLQDLSQSRDRLFHDISHEVRSPLARVQAAMGLLRINPARSEVMLARMDTDIERMNRLLEEILTLARIESSEPKALPRHETDLVDLISNIVEDANFEGQDRKVKCRYTGQQSLLLQADPELLHRAFENIIRNALRFSSQGGNIIVKGVERQNTICIKITDAGPGVPEDELSSLFQPFVRSSRSPKKAGIGLGLAIAQRAVQLHNGSISASNLEAGGLAIEIILPVSAAI